ncbi:MAG: DNA cytosine methyltransferase, partial [Prevotellaceae bacterium]|nr:DNA cytosine methyltransferase [Prevotellaceae bacterium]
PCAVRGRGDGNKPSLEARDGTAANALTTVRKDSLVMERGARCRVRMLTERECFRLMDVEEGDIDTLLSAGVSRCQLYKLAGNSIVVACLYHILRKLLADTGSEDKQMTLW